MNRKRLKPSGRLMVTKHFLILELLLLLNVNEQELELLDIPLGKRLKGK